MGRKAQFSPKAGDATMIGIPSGWEEIAAIVPVNKYYGSTKERLLDNLRSITPITVWFAPYLIYDRRSSQKDAL